MRVPRILSVVLLGVGVATFAFAPRGWADDYTNRVGIMLGGGAYKLVGGAKDHTRIGPWAQTGLRFGWKRNLDIEGTYRYGFNWDDTQTYRATTSGLDLGLLWSMKPDAKFTAQVLGGSGVLWWNVDDFNIYTEADSARGSPSVFDSGRNSNGFKEDGNAAHLNSSNWKVYFGIGAEYTLIPRLTLRALARIDYLIDQTIDNTGASAGIDSTGAPLPGEVNDVDANDLMPAFALSLTYWFGERDSDGDGIPNRLDACKYEAEDLDKFQDEDGCPELDNDGDGIPDLQDKCADQPEDKDGFQDEDGCPDPDNDGDGVLDAADKCPDQVEDKDSFQDEDGCPDLDNDGDAVPDSLDQCADTPAGSRVDEKGCPVSAQETRFIETGVIRQHVSFATGKADILPESASLLDGGAAILVKYPDLQIEIGGHTDSQGSAASNQELSQRRAQAVLDYLKSSNPALDTSKYTVKGYGENIPIADNNTDVGRAENRRVEFKVLNPEALQKKKE